MMDDERVLRRWIRLEIGKMNDGVVNERVPIMDLLGMERPVAVTRGGKEHRFDREVIRRISSALSPDLSRNIRLPIVFYYSMDVSDSCMLSDPHAFSALQVMGSFPGKGRWRVAAYGWEGQLSLNWCARIRPQSRS